MEASVVEGSVEGGVVGPLRSAVDGLVGLDPDVLADAGSVVGLCRELGRLEAVVAGAVGALEVSGGWAAAGFRSPVQWLVARCRVSAGAAGRWVRLGRAARALGAVAGAWRAGEIAPGHVEAIAAASGRGTEALLVRDEGVLLDAARRVDVGAFRRVMAYWRQRADAEAVEADAGAVRAGRRVHLSRTFAGGWVGDVVLDPVGGAVVAGELGRLERELFDADWAEARARRGDAACAADVGRSGAQRRADALVEMAARSASAAPGGRRPAPLFTVLVGYETLAGRVCELADGTVLAPGSLVPWLAAAEVERVVFDSASRVIDVGVRRRLFTGATRRAVEVRDRSCFAEGCGLPAEACEVDHVVPWSAGGPTVAANGRLACGWHNRARHRRRP